MTSSTTDTEMSVNALIAQRLQSLLMTIPHGVQENDLSGIITFSNPAHHRMLGFEPGELVGKAIWDLTYEPAEREQLKDYLSHLISKQPQPTPHICLSRCKDGSPLLTQVDWTYQYDGTGQLVGFVSIITDISEHARTQQDLNRKHSYLQHLDRISLVMSRASDSEGMLQAVVSEMLDIFQADRVWLLHPCDLSAPSYKVLVEATTPRYPGAFALNIEVPVDDHARAVFHQALASDDPIEVDLVHDPRVGKVLQPFQTKTELLIVLRPRVGKPWVLGMHQCNYQRQWTAEEKSLLREIAARISDGLTSFILLRQLKEDVAKREAAEEALRKERDLARHYLEVAQFMLVILDSAGRISLVNRKACEILGFSADQLLGQEWIDLCVPEAEKESVRQIFNCLLQGDSASVEYFENNIVTAKGEQRLIAWHNTVQRDVQGRICGTLSSGEDVTEHRMAERTLRASEAKYRTLVENLPQRVFLKDRNSVFISCNQRFAADLGIEADAIQGCTDYDFSPPELAEKYRQDDQRIIASGETDTLLEEDRFQGTTRYVQTVKTPIRDDAGEVTGILGIFWDITRQRESEERLRLSSAVFEHTTEGVMICDANLGLIAVNRAFTEITGYKELEVLGKSPHILQSGRHEETFYQQMWTLLKDTGSWQGEVWNRRKNGEIYPEWLNISEVRGEHGDVTHYVGIFLDISMLKESEARLQFLAHHDPLTRLPNRDLFHIRIEHAIEQARREKQKIAVLFIDLDRFKDINDSLGHAVGDDLLKCVAERLLGCVRKEDTVTRLGGDEFALLLGAVDDVQTAERVAKNILHALHRGMNIKGNELFISGSIGISIYPDDANDSHSLLKNSDSAMYQAKGKGRGTFQFYSREMTVAAMRRISLEGQLRRALKNQELVLLYQPQVNIRTGRCVGVEALLRWQHPEYGLMLPMEFIPLAEAVGLIAPIGEWVLQAACEDRSSWRPEQDPQFRVAVNLSIKQLLRSNLVERYRHIIQHSGVQPEWLELEVTESTVMDDPERSIAILRQLRELGIRLSVDDFGTGYSSLSYLRQLPIDNLKIDRSFVHDISQSCDGESIIRAIIALGKSLQLSILAEGVETAQQLAFLKANGCDQYQGYLYMPPVTPVQIAALLVQDAAAI